LIAHPLLFDDFRDVGGQPFREPQPLHVLPIQKRNGNCISNLGYRIVFSHERFEELEHLRRNLGVSLT